MRFRSLMILSLVLMVSGSAESAEKKPHRKANRGPASIASTLPGKNTDLTRIYQSLMRDSQKQLSPSVGEHNIYLPVSYSISNNRAPASNSYPSQTAQHAAIPWATDANFAGAVFSVK